MEVRKVDVNALAPEQAERVSALALELLSAISDLTSVVAKKADLSASDALRLHHEILLAVVASMLDTHLKVLHKLAQSDVSGEKYDMNDMEVF